MNQYILGFEIFTICVCSVVFPVHQDIHSVGFFFIHVEEPLPTVTSNLSSIRASIRK